MSEFPVVGGREPCPCGSGRRYKACHGKDRATTTFVARPFAGLPNESEWVALREIVPAATGKIKLRDGSTVLVCSVLPNAVAAMHREDGQLMVGLQIQTSSGDASRDIAGALKAVMKLEPGYAVAAGDLTNTERIQDLIGDQPSFSIDVHEDFSFWFSDQELSEENTRKSLEEFEGIIPVERIKVDSGSAFWCEFSERTVVRWILTTEEEKSLDALARLGASDELNVGEGTRYLGAFRADGLLVPVFDVNPETPVRTFELTLANLSKLFSKAFENKNPLNSAERKVRAGLVGRQLTLR